MVYCPNCKSINVKVLDLDFATKKVEGEPADKLDAIKKQFCCQGKTCSWVWFSNPESDKLYVEYCDSKIGTVLFAQIMRSGGQYTPQTIDINRLMRRKELARILVADHKHFLDLNPSDWYDLELDARS